MDMQALQEFIHRLQGTGSRLEKEAILKEATEDQKKVLEFLFNPYKITGISKKKLAGRRALKTGSGVSLENLLSYLSRHSTGSNHDIDYVCEVAGETGYEDLVFSIVRKDLVLGVNATTLNKVYGKGFIPTFGVMLADKYFDDPDKAVPEGTEFIITEKLDGVRCVLIFDDSGLPRFYTRSGREVAGLIDITREARTLDRDFVYDGELLVAQNGKSNNLYRETMSVVGSDGVKRGVVFNVFDCLTKKEFNEGLSNIPAKERKNALSKMVEHLEWIKEVPILYQGTDKSKIISLLSWARGSGKEGVMINIADAPYVCDRTSGLLKVKVFSECEAVVRSIEKGTGKNENRLGAVIVDIKDKKDNFHRVRVGSGFTDVQRDYYFIHQEELVGKVVEIGYFEVTQNKADNSLSLRFPTWLDRIRMDKMESEITPV